MKAKKRKASLEARRKDFDGMKGDRKGYHRPG